MSGSEYRSGFASLVGRPNVGKSTLLNGLLGQKLAIVSPKPQTTRNSIRGIKTRPDAQIIYVDTPGLHAAQDGLSRFMAAATTEALEGVDVVVWVTDVTRRTLDPDDEVLARLRALGVPVVLALNKVDLLGEKSRLLTVLETQAARYPFRALVPISAATGDGLDRLEGAVLAELQAGPAMYPEATVTDQPEVLFVAERIREKIFFETRQEVPYATAVRVDEMVERGASGVLYIRATVFVEQTSQKAIVIGEKGQRLRAVGRSARQDLERFFGVKVFLDLWVQVRRRWREDPSVLRELGYQLTS